MQHSRLWVEVLNFEFTVDSHFRECTIIGVFEHWLGLQAVHLNFIDPVVYFLVGYLQLVLACLNEDLTSYDGLTVRRWVELEILLVNL